MSQAVLLEPLKKKQKHLGSVLLGTASHRAGNKVLCEEVGFDKSQIKQKETPKKQFGGGAGRGVTLPSEPDRPGVH